MFVAFLLALIQMFNEKSDVTSVIKPRYTQFIKLKRFMGLQYVAFFFFAAPLTNKDLLNFLI